MRRFFLCLLLLIAPLAPTGSWAEDVSLSPTQMAEAAGQALAANQPQVALAMAQALLNRNPNDLGALLIKARALRDLGQNADARAVAKQAWRVADTDREQFAAAMIRAQVLASSNNDVAAQFWLRQASQHATSREQRQLVARDFRFIRARNPLSVKLSFGVVPSSNINGGANNDGSGTFSGSAQALPGYQASASGTLSYRILKTEHNETSIGVNALGRWSWLSQAAQATAPTVSNSDYAYQSLALTFAHKHTFSTGQLLGLNGSIGRNWYGGQHFTNFASLGATFTIPRDNGDRYTLFGQWGQQRRSAAFSSDVTTTSGLGFSMFHPLPEQASVKLTLRIDQSESGSWERNYIKPGVRVDYTFGKPVLGGRLSVGLGMSWLRNETPFAGFPYNAPTGRLDREISVQADLSLPRFSLYGFSPVVTLKHETTASNVDRFSSDLTSVSINFRSDF